MTDRIFVTLSTFAEFADEPLTLLQESGIEFFTNPHGRRITREEIIELGDEATGIVAGVEPYDREVLNALPRLKCISRCGVGIDSIDLVEAKKRGIVIRNTPDVVIQPVAELTVAMIFDLLRRLSLFTHLMKGRRWEKHPGNLLAGKTAGIIGLGRIGRRVAELLVQLDVTVLGADVSPDTAWAKKLGVKIVDMDILLEQSDIVSIHVAASTDTPFMLGGAELSRMKEGAFLVNVSRGNMVDENALYDSLNSGLLAGAALDVFPQEPYSGLLCDLDNVVMTPHVATLTKESRTMMEYEAVRNLLDVLGEVNG